MLSPLASLVLIITICCLKSPCVLSLIPIVKSIPNERRRMYTAMVHHLQDMTKLVVDALKATGRYDNSVILFTSDNGGRKQYASNYPLRGFKSSEFEGGVRLPSFIFGGLVPAAKRGTKTSDLIHLADWWPTFCGLAGVEPNDPKAVLHGLVEQVDGVDQWAALTTNAQSPRNEVPLGSNAYIQGNYKYISDQLRDIADWSSPRFPQTDSTRSGWDVRTKTEKTSGRGRVRARGKEVTPQRRFH
eukprot:m.184284 g.184284  ORF g.184284 m.184284 type:complete len:244 (-) comp25534_c1_seq1:852-1583(-)